MVGVARALQDAGHEVRVATSEEFCSAVASLGLRPSAAGISDQDMVGEARRRWPEVEHEPPSSWAARMFTDIAAPPMVTDLQKAIAAWRPDLVVREEGEYGAPVAAAAAGVPWITHGWGRPLPTSGEAETVATRVAPLWREAGLPPPDAGGLYGALVLDPCPPSLYGGDRPPFRVRPLRPTVDDPPGARDSFEWPSRPLAYVGFGTVPLYRDQPALIATVVEALLAAGFSSVVTTPDSELGRELRSLDAEHVRVHEWVSLPCLLPSCDLVVCHGGAGTVLAALASGVPLLLLPRGAPSQLRMSRACGERGVAHALAPDGVGRSQLDAALADLTDDHRFAGAARELAEEIAGMPDAAEVAHSLTGS
jgi:UDP:flavonoid glycosyltransferase YjiC (YdhE family)